MKKIIVAIDGPAGSGKTTTARESAKLLNYIHIDTGAMYRLVTLACIRECVEINEKSVCPIVEKINVELRQSPKGQRSLLDGEDASDAIRKPEVTKLVSPIAALRCVREKMTALQRKLGDGGGVVMDGRDVGAAVFPNADLKIYLNASIEVRAKRRFLEMRAAGIDADLDEIKADVARRDEYDSSREISPLRKADDAIEIDTSNLTIEQQTAEIVRLAREIIDKDD